MTKVKFFSIEPHWNKSFSNLLLGNWFSIPASTTTQTSEQFPPPISWPETMSPMDQCLARCWFCASCKARQMEDQLELDWLGRHRVWSWSRPTHARPRKYCHCMIALACRCRTGQTMILKQVWTDFVNKTGRTVIIGTTKKQAWGWHQSR